MARNKRHSAMAEINVVPYIDVTLVLLIIFMVTTPLLVQGVQVDLPKASAKPVDKNDEEPLIISVDKGGSFYINLGAEPKQPVALENVQDQVGKILRRKPDTEVFVWGDQNVPYGQVVTLMTALQAAGAPSVGLVTEDQPKQP
jgi:biopolymer transport protein TolR